MKWCMRNKHFMKNIYWELSLDSLKTLDVLLCVPNVGSQPWRHSRGSNTQQDWFSITRDREREREVFWTIFLSMTNILPLTSLGDGIGLTKIRESNATRSVTAVHSDSACLFLRASSCIDTQEIIKITMLMFSVVLKLVDSKILHFVTASMSFVWQASFMWGFSMLFDHVKQVLTVTVTMTHPAYIVQTSLTSLLIRRGISMMEVGDSQRQCIVTCNSQDNSLVSEQCIIMLPQQVRYNILVFFSHPKYVSKRVESVDETPEVKVVHAKKKSFQEETCRFEVKFWCRSWRSLTDLIAVCVVKIMMPPQSVHSTSPLLKKNCPCTLSMMASSEIWVIWCI